MYFYANVHTFYLLCHWEATMGLQRNSNNCAYVILVMVNELEARSSCWSTIIDSIICRIFLITYKHTTLVYLVTLFLEPFNIYHCKICIMKDTHFLYLQKELLATLFQTGMLFKIVFKYSSHFHVASISVSSFFQQNLFCVRMIFLFYSYFVLNVLGAYLKRQLFSTLDTLEETVVSAKYII